MKILVAVADTSNPRPDDFNFTFEGEPLSLPTIICSTPRRRQHCGCGRAFSGIESERSTTYAVVDELTYAEEAEFGTYFRDSPHVDAWRRNGVPVDKTAAILWADLVEIEQLIAHLPAGTIVRVSSTPTAFALILSDGTRLHGSRSPGLQAMVAAAVR